MYGLFTRGMTYTHIANGLIAIGWWLSFFANILDRDYVWIWVTGIAAVFYTWLWWRNRKKGKWKKILKEAGAKTRAIIVNMVKNMTPSPIPSLTRA